MDNELYDFADYLLENYLNDMDDNVTAVASLVDRFSLELIDDFMGLSDDEWREVIDILDEFYDDDDVAEFTGRILHHLKARKTHADELQKAIQNALDR